MLSFCQRTLPTGYQRQSSGAPKSAKSTKGILTLWSGMILFNLCGKPMLNTRSASLTQSAIVASQDWLLADRPLSDYLKGQHRLKAWVIEPGPHHKTLEWINYQVARPWYRRRYDWLGVIGHAIGLPWINVPWSNYCSEFAGAVLTPYAHGRSFRSHPTPNDINRALKQPHNWLLFEPCVLCRFDPTLDIDEKEKNQ